MGLWASFALLIEFLRSGTQPILLLQGLALIPLIISWIWTIIEFISVFTTQEKGSVYSDEAVGE